MLLAIVLWISGCTGQPQAGQSPEPGSPVASSPVASPQTTTPSPTLPASVAEKVLQAAADQANVDTTGLKVVRSMPQTWPDGCLGLGKPDEVCSQALVDGWQVEVALAQGGTQQWVFHTDQTGQVIRFAE
jgi:hypothetical protein